MIRYVTLGQTETAVILEGKRVGTIRQTLAGWSYCPKGSKAHGLAFPTLVECKESLSAHGG